MIDKRGYLKSIAIFMSCLIISLPLYSASVFAGLDSIVAKGSDGINDYVKEDDYVDFKVTASIEGDTEITNDQVWLGQNFIFDSCRPSIEGGYECEFRYPSSGTEHRDARAHTYTIHLIVDGGDVGNVNDRADTQSGVFFVDNLAPSVKSPFSISPGTSTGAITLTYTVEDYAYSKGDTSKCSGIEKIEFRKGSISGSLLDTKPLNTAACSRSGTRDYTYSGSDGLIKIYAVAYDRFGQSSTDEVYAEFTLDTTGPAINLVDIVSSRGDSINYLGGGSASVSVMANITAAGLDTDSIKADLSSLGRGTEESRDSIETVGDYVIAKWSVSVSAGTAINIGVEASDTLGNKATKTFTRTLGVDTTTPVVTSLQTVKVHNSLSYAKATKNNFTATFTETESGLNPNDVILHIKTTTVPANKCDDSGGVWTCYWYDTNVDLSGSITTTVYIWTDTKDRAGNSVVDKFPIDINVDNTKPVIKSINVTSPITDYIGTGDTITVIANVSDGAPVVYGYGDLSKAISSMADEKVECTKEGSYFICKWEGIVDSGAGSAELKFKICDLVDNCVEDDTAKKTITIYEREEEVPDFYEWVKNEAYIEPIDKQVASHFIGDYYYQIVPFTLTHEMEEGSLCSSIKIVNVKLTGSGCSSGSYVNYNKAANDLDYYGFFQFAIDPSAVSGDSITFGDETNPCYLEFNVICNGVVYSTAEKEQIYFSVPIVDSEAPDEILVDDIEKIKDRVDSEFGKLIETAERIIVILQNICAIKSTFSSIITVINVVGMLWSKCINNPVTGAKCKAGEGAAKAKFALVEIKENLMNKIINQMCSLVTCTNKGDTSYTRDLKWQDFKLGAWCDVLREWLMAIIPNDIAAGLVGASWPSTLQLAKKSWIFSIGCLCIPGMVYNLKKMQELECWKAYCFQKMVPAGLPVEECRKQYKYQNCVYWYGQFTAILDLLPFNAIMEYIANPIAAAWTWARFGLGKACMASIVCPESATCIASWTGWCIPYNIMLIMENVAQITQFFETMDEMQWEPTMNFCDMLD